MLFCIGALMLNPALFKLTKPTGGLRHRWFQIITRFLLYFAEDDRPCLDGLCLNTLSKLVTIWIRYRKLASYIYISTDHDESIQWWYLKPLYNGKSVSRIIIFLSYLASDLHTASGPLEACYTFYQFSLCPIQTMNILLVLQKGKTLVKIRVKSIFCWDIFSLLNNSRGGPKTFLSNMAAIFKMAMHISKFCLSCGIVSFQNYRPIRWSSKRPFWAGPIRRIKFPATVSGSRGIHGSDEGNAGIVYGRDWNSVQNRLSGIQLCPKKCSITHWK